MQNVIRAIEGKIIEIVKHDKSIKLSKNFDFSLLNEELDKPLPALPW
jgi:hypothetical protein